MIAVSVVIPVYNVEKYIEECLRSVLEQTLCDVEIICVDDGSQDASMEVVEKYAKIDNRIVIIHKENGGLSSARNAGIKTARGKYIYFLDSDDYILEDTLEFLYQEMEKDELDSIFFDADSFYESEELAERHKSWKETYHRPDIYEEVVTGMRLVEKMALNDDFKPSACLQMNRTSLLTENGILFKEGIIHEDNLFTLQASIHAKRAKHIAKAFYQRRVRDDSIMTARTALGSAYGYLLCIEGILKEIFGSGSEDMRRVYVPQLRRMRNVAAGALKKLTNEEFENIEIEASFEQKILFDFAIKDYAALAKKKDKRIAKLKKEVEQLEIENERMTKELAEIKKSKLYRVIKRF